MAEMPREADAPKSLFENSAATLRQGTAVPNKAYTPPAEAFAAGMSYPP